MNGQARLPRLFWFVIGLAIVGGVVAAVSSFTTAADVQAAHKQDVDRNFAGIECTIQLVRMDPAARAALTDEEVRKLCPILTEAEAHRAASTTTTTTAPPARPGGQSSGRTTTTRPASTAPAAPPGRSPSTTGAQPSPPTTSAPAPTQPPPPPSTTTTTAPPPRCRLPVTIPKGCP